MIQSPASRLGQCAAASASWHGRSLPVRDSGSDRTGVLQVTNRNTILCPFFVSLSASGTGSKNFRFFLSGAGLAGNANSSNTEHLQPFSPVFRFG